jgi:hypothetical protein
MKSTLLPLAMIWLAAHALILALILGLKFLAAKTVVLLALAGAVLMFVLKRKPALPRLTGMV